MLPEWEIAGNKITILNTEIPLKGVPIKMLDIGNYLAVLCEDPGNSRNISLFGRDSKLVWEVEASPSSAAPGYAKLFRINCELVAIDFEGRKWKIDTKTGAVEKLTV